MTGQQDSDAAILTLIQTQVREARRLQEQGDYRGAHHLYRTALELCEEKVGKHHTETARLLNALADLVQQQGDYARARSLLERAFEIQRDLLGEEHEESARSLNDLGILLVQQGEKQNGHAMVERAMQIRRARLGELHEDTAESVHNLAVLAHLDGDHGRAEQLHRWALAIREQLFGDRHRLVAQSLMSYGALLAEQRKYQDARSLYERALAINEERLGPDHLETGRSLHNLGTLLVDLKEISRARALLQRSLAIHEKILGKQHLHVASVLMSLADLHYLCREYEPARFLYERALVIRERAFGAHHPDTIRTLHQLTAVLGDLGDMVDGMAFFQALGVLDGSSAGLSRWVAPDLHELVNRLEKKHQGRAPTPEEAARLDQAGSLSGRATEHSSRGEYEAAAQLLQEALALRESVYGPYHMEHISLLEELIVVRRSQHEYDEALHLQERLAEIQKELLGEEHPLTILALTRLAGMQSEAYGADSSWSTFGRLFSLLGGGISPEQQEGFLDALPFLDTRESPEMRISKWEKRRQAISRPGQSKLHGLDEIEWGSMGHAHGPASDIPELLQAMLVEEAAIRREAASDLLENICHQGTVCEAASYVVPFLLRMVTMTGVPDRKLPLQLLRNLAESEDGTPAVHEAIGAGIPLYIDLLEEEDREIAKTSLGILTHCREQADAFLHRLISLLQESDDPEWRADLLAALHVILDDNELARHLFMRCTRQDKSEKVRFLAAAALVERAHEETPDEVVTILLSEAGNLYDTFVEDWDIEAIWQPELLLECENLTLLIAVNTLLQVGRARTVHGLLQLLRVVRNEAEIEMIAGILLDLHFNDGTIEERYPDYSYDDDETPLATLMTLFLDPEKPRERGPLTIQYPYDTLPPMRAATTLNQEQRELLSILLHHNPMWRYRSNLLRLFGLPDTREALQAYLF